MFRAFRVYSESPNLGTCLRDAVASFRHVPTIVVRDLRVQC